MAQDELWSLYGNIGNHRVVAIRSICRNRLTGIDEFSIRANLDKTRKDAENTAKTIRTLDGSEEAAKKADKISNVLAYWKQRPKDLRQIVLNQYGKTIRGTDRDVGTADYGADSCKCPFEKNPESRSCWGCHVPVKVWEQMEAQYDKEK